MADYLEAQERGCAPDREAFLAEHPEIADALREFLDDYESVNRVMPGQQQDKSTDGAARSTGGGRAIAPILPVPRNFGAFELLEEIARGGMGVVYKARQKNPERIVALKMILAGQLASQADVERFSAEAHAAAALDHPGIVPVFEVGQHEGQHYFTMGFVAGLSLAQRLLDGPLPAREAATIVAEVGGAVHYAHQRGVIHRDLKPANILLDDSGRVRVTDFGLAKRQTDGSGLTHTGQLLGTPSFMSPEQVSGNSAAIGPAADVYSLGATLYALLTGRPPFQAASTIDTLKQVTDREPVPPRELDASISRDLETIVLKALSKEPGSRYHTSDEMAEDLLRFVADRPILARRSTARERLVRWCRRNPAIAALTATAAAALIAGTGVSTYYAIQADARAREARTAVVARDGALVAKGNALQLAQDKELLERQRLYAAEMNLAQQALTAGHSARVLDLLENHRPKGGEPDLRGFEWHYLWREIHPGLRATLTYTNGLNVQLGGLPRLDGSYGAVAISSDGSTVALGYALIGDRFGIELRDANTGRLKSTLPSSPYMIRCLAYSPNGQLLASGSQGGPIRLWNASDGTLVGQSADDWDYARCMAFSPDANRLAVAGDGVVIYDIRADEPRRELELQREFADSVVYSPDGGRLYAGASFGDKNDGTRRLSRIYDLTVQPPKAVRELDETTIWDVSPDGRFVAASNPTNNVLLDADGGATLWEFGQGGPGSWMKFTADGTTLIAAGVDRMVSVWDAVERKLLCRLPHSGAVVGIATASGGRDCWASLSTDGTAKIWPARPSAALKVIHPELPNRHMVAMRGGQSVILVGDEFPAQSWSLETGTRTDDPLPADDIRAVSADGARMASVDRVPTVGSPMVRVWDLASNSQPNVLTLGGSRGSSSSLHVRLSPNGRWVASYEDWINVIHVNELDGAPPTREAPKAIRYSNPSFWLLCPVLHVEFSPDSRWLAAAHQFGVVNLYNLESEQIVPVPVPSASAATQVAFSSDNRYLASGTDTGNAHVFDMQTAEVIASFPGHESAITALAFFPGDRTLAVGSRGAIRLWDLPSRQERFTVRPAADAAQTSESAVVQLAVTPDGATLLSRQSDGTVRIWKAPGNSTEAAATARHAVATLSNDPQFLARRAIAQVGLGHWEQALADLRDAQTNGIKWSGELLRLLHRALPRERESTRWNELETVTTARDIFRSGALRLDDPHELARLCWDLVAEGATDDDQSALAVQLAQKAGELAPNDAFNMSTLGMAQYRAGQWQQAVDSLDKARVLAPDKHIAFNGFFLAMAHWQLGHKDEARTWYDRSVEWMEKNQPKNDDLSRFRAEAEQLMGITKPDAAPANAP
ncbi:MAG: protein kinase [Pirellulales bacterium]|nr:protein kinase [Pirellulales bacterium]